MIKLITFILRFITIFLFGGLASILSAIVALILWDKKYMSMLEMVMDDLTEHRIFK